MESITLFLDATIMYLTDALDECPYTICRHPGRSRIVVLRNDVSPPRAALTVNVEGPHKDGEGVAFSTELHDPNLENVWSEFVKLIDVIGERLPDRGSDGTEPQPEPKPINKAQLRARDRKAKARELKDVHRLTNKEIAVELGLSGKNGTRTVQRYLNEK